jgi:anti-anti-sigma factor
VESLQVQVFRSAAPSGAALAWIRVTGELDVATISSLAAALAEVGDTARAVIDLRRVSFMDLASLRLLVAERQRRFQRGHAVDVLIASRAVDRLLSVTGTREQLVGRPAVQRRAPAGAGISQT